MYWWAMQRVKDVEMFDRELNRPLPGMAAGREVTDAELERDSQSFMAFATAFGIKPPTQIGPGDAPALPSAPASEQGG